MSETFYHEIHCNVPGSEPIKLITGYSRFLNYWPQAEINTREWFNKNIKPEWTMIDCGANIGMYSVQFAKKCKFVYAVEACQNTTKLLEKNLAYNNLNNVEIVNKALGEKSGEFTDRVLILWPDIFENKKFQFISVDDLVAEKNIKVDCMKIDVDSYECEVLNGSIKTLKEQSPICLIEVNKDSHMRGRKESDIINFMKSQGYRIENVFDHENYLFMKN